jgi:hypothetical protein
MDAKEREKAKRQADKEAGVERVAQKRKKVMEDHYHDCGDSVDGVSKDAQRAEGYSYDGGELLDEHVDSHSHLHFSTQWVMGSELNYAMRELSDGS